MLLGTITLFIITLTIISIVGTKARARFLICLRDYEPDVYDQLGSPRIWISTSFSRGVKTMRLVFAKNKELGNQAEAARHYYRRVTTAVLIALFLNLIIPLGLNSTLPYGAHCVSISGKYIKT